MYAASHPLRKTNAPLHFRFAVSAGRSLPLIGIRSKIYARPSNTTTTPPLHVAYTQQGYEAGNGREKMAVGTRVSIQAERQECAGQAGYSHAQV